MSYLRSMQYVKVISSENSLGLKPTSVPCLTNTKANQTKQSLKTQQISLGLLPNVPVYFNDIPTDSNYGAFFESPPFQSPLMRSVC